MKLTYTEGYSANNGAARGQKSKLLHVETADGKEAFATGCVGKALSSWLRICFKAVGCKPPHKGSGCLEYPGI